MNSHIVEVKFDVDNDWVNKTTLLEEAMFRYGFADLGYGVCFVSSPPIRDIQWICDGICDEDEVETITEILYSIGESWPGFTVHITELNEELDDE